MKTRKLVIALSITTLIVVIILISMEAYYVTVALIVGTLLMGHRELWALVRRKKPPVIDERVKDNIGKSIRNGFVFLVMALAFLMLPFGTGFIKDVDIVHILGGLFLSAGTIYLLSYLYYDKVAVALNEKWSKVLRVFLLLTGISLGVFIISVFLHNAIYGLLELWFGEGFWNRIGVEDEPVFFFLAILSAVSFTAGIAGSLVVFVRGLIGKPG